MCEWKHFKTRWTFGKVASQNVFVSCTFFVFSSVLAERASAETIAFLLVTSPNVHRFFGGMSPAECAFVCVCVFSWTALLHCRVGRREGSCRRSTVSCWFLFLVPRVFFSESFATGFAARELEVAKCYCFPSLFRSRLNTCLVCKSFPP